MLLLLLLRSSDAIRMSLGSSNNLVWKNKMMIHGPESKYVIYMYQGSDIPDASDGRPTNNHIYDNTLISDDEVAKMLNADDNTIEVRNKRRREEEGPPKSVCRLSKKYTHNHSEQWHRKTHTHTYLTALPRTFRSPPPP